MYAPAPPPHPTLTPFLASISISLDLTGRCFFSAGINHFHKTPDREWFETDAVLRVSLGNFLFFTILAAIMAGIKDQKDPRDKVHHGGWMAKIFCWVVVVFLMFFVPNGVVSFYGERTLSHHARSWL